METILTLTGGIGADWVIDAVGVDSQHAHGGPAAKGREEKAGKFAVEVKQVAPEQHSHDGQWMPGDAPTQALEWAIAALAKADTLGIIGVYLLSAETFPIGIAMNKNLTIRMGNCNHHAYIPKLVGMVRTGLVDPVTVLTKVEPMSDVIAACEAFDTRQPGWIKTGLKPAA